MIALVQGFLPEADISLLIPGGIGFIGTAIAAAKVAVVA